MALAATGPVTLWGRRIGWTGENPALPGVTLPAAVTVTERLEEARAEVLLVAIPVLVWTLLPIYHLFVLSISNQESMLAGKLWPDQPTLQNFQIVFNQQHYYLGNFWRQMFNSFFIAVATGVLTLFVAGPNQRTLARQMFSSIRENISPAVAAAAFLLILGTLLLAGLAALLRWRQERSLAAKV